MPIRIYFDIYFNKLLKEIREIINVSYLLRLIEVSGKNLKTKKCPYHIQIKKRRILISQAKF